MDDRTQKIELLSRMNRQRAAAPAFLAGLSETLGEPIEASALTPVSDADTIQEAFRTGYQSAISQGTLSYRRIFPPHKRSTLFSIVDCFAESLPSEEVFLLSKLGKDRPVVKLDISVLLRHAASVIKFDGDSLSALSRDLSQGVLIDHNSDDPHEAYEIVVWGERWPLPLLALSYPRQGNPKEAH
jgi:hypothetical protein